MANDFSSDANCVALYRLEDGAGLVDSKGSNTLSQVQGSLSYNTSVFKEGAASGETAAALTLNRADASLSAGFPGKTGDTTLDLSVCFWAYAASIASNRVIVSKAQGAGSVSWAVLFDSATVKIFLDNLGQILADSSTTIGQNKWYHIGFTIQGVDKAYRIRIWDDSGSSVGETTGTATKNIRANAAALNLFSLGSSFNFAGKLDEVVIFNDILTADEIDEIRQGTFGPAGPVTEEKTFTADVNLTDSLTHQHPFTADVNLVKLTAKCLNIVYDTPTSGTIWYAEAAGVFPDDSTVTGGGNTVDMNGEAVADPTFYPQGEVKINSGPNTGERRQVLKDIGNNTTVQWPFPNDLEVGDNYSIYPGCDKTAETCKEKFGNSKNFRGYIYIPKVEETIT